MRATSLCKSVQRFIYTMSSSNRFSLSALPLPPITHSLPRNLTPDPHVPTPEDLRKVQREKPSIQRRARLLAAQAHFSYVAPYPIPFPFRIVPEEGEEVTDQAAFIEKWLAEREAVHELSDVPIPESSTPLKKYYPKKRDQPLELIGLSETGLRDCLPHLHVGDAFDTLGSPTLSKAHEEETEQYYPPEQDVTARRELIDILSGHALLMNTSDENPWAPWSLRYNGHQFGVWAGQLGDGRAISILATPHPSDPDLIYELQLKGAGRTPFSRSADGLAVVRSSIREFLCAEAMYALRIPTTRSLSLAFLPSLPVVRERVESACILARLAPSFIRIGSFEALNPPEGVFYLGGGQQNPDWDALRILGEWVGRRVLMLSDVKWEEDGAWGRALVTEVAKRNAKMVAGWQAYGFMHGVINTDNVSILGLTIDYGPYAFMDVFNAYHICNHSDGEGRYAYNNQPSMILYALRALVNALAPLIGAEISQGNKAVTAGWTDDISDTRLTEWRTKGNEDTLQEVEDLFRDVCAKEYSRLIHKRLGLRRTDANDESTLGRPLLDIMSEHKLDFHSTFRRLAYFRPSWVQSADDPNAQKELDGFIATILALSPESEMMNKTKATDDIKHWLERYASRIADERAEWSSSVDVDIEREKAMRAANPRFVLRQWVLEEVIKKVEEDAKSGKRVLRKVLQMSCSPFEPWGGENDPTPEESLDPEVREERRYCSLGEKKMLGFQCSCSS